MNKKQRLAVILLIIAIIISIISIVVSISIDSLDGESGDEPSPEHLEAQGKVQLIVQRPESEVNDKG